MTITLHRPRVARAPADPTRRIARAAGALYLLTFVTSIPALALYQPVLNNAHYIVGSGSDVRVFVGALLEVICALAGIASAVVLFPIVKRQHEGAALGFVTSRVVEGLVIIVGVLSLLSVVTLRRGAGGGSAADHAALLTTGKGLVALHNWTFLLGPGVMPGINALLLGYLLYRSGLVPRIIPTFGLIGGPLLLGSAVAILFGAYEQLSVWSALTTVPDFLWELALGVWLFAKGFTPSPLIAGPDRTRVAANDAGPSALESNV